MGLVPKVGTPPKQKEISAVYCVLGEKRCFFTRGTLPKRKSVRCAMCCARSHVFMSPLGDVRTQLTSPLTSRHTNITHHRKAFSTEAERRGDVSIPQFYWLFKNFSPLVSYPLWWSPGLKPLFHQKCPMQQWYDHVKAKLRNYANVYTNAKLYIRMSEIFYEASQNRWAKMNSSINTMRRWLGRFGEHSALHIATPLLYSMRLSHVQLIPSSRSSVIVMSHRLIIV